MEFFVISLLFAATFGVGFGMGYRTRDSVSRRRRDRAREQFVYPA